MNKPKRQQALKLIFAVSFVSGVLENVTNYQLFGEQFGSGNTEKKFSRQSQYYLSLILMTSTDQIKPTIRNYTGYFFSYSLFYFALRMWRRHFEFLPEIENSSFVIEILMFFLTGLLFTININLDARTKNHFYANVCLVPFLVVSNNLYWNGYAYLMAPHVEHLALSVGDFTGYLLIGLFAISPVFILSKQLNCIYENYFKRG